MFEEISPVKKAAVFMVFMFMLALLIFTKAYLPYMDYLKLSSDCVESVQGVVFEAKAPYNDGGLYYGPIVEYVIPSNGYLVHSEAVSTIKSPRKYKEGEKVNIIFNGNLNSDVIITDDTTCYDRYRIMSIIAVVIAWVGLLDFVINVFISIRKNKGETHKFKATPDGKSFKEWQEMQQLREAAEDAQKKLTETMKEQNAPDDESSDDHEGSAE